MTRREELDYFLEKTDELIESKYILAEIKIMNVLKSISVSESLLAIFKNCLSLFDYEEAKKKYLVKNKYTSDNIGEFLLPDNSKELLAFIFTLLVDFDAKRIDFGEFIGKYFYEDGSYSASFAAFINGMIRPFRNSVKMLMESVIDGKVQDPIEALVQEEKKKAEQKALLEKEAKKEEELLRKNYGASVKAIKELLLDDKSKLKNSKLKDEEKEELSLIIDMLANVIESEDADAIYYAYVAYKYCAKAHPVMFFGKVKKISNLLEDVFSGIKK